MYFYHANALALGGTYVRPFQQVIPTQADCSLPITGGTSTARAEKFNFNDVISFDSAQSDVAGGKETKNGQDVYVSRVSIVIEGLNILNMFMADRIVARLATEHLWCDPKPKDPEPKIITTGCHYDNLRIAGHAVEVETAHNVFSDLPTYGDCQNALKGTGKDKKKDNENKEKLSDRLVGKTLTSAPGKTDPQHLKDVHEGCES